MSRIAFALVFAVFFAACMDPYLKKQYAGQYEWTVTYVECPPGVQWCEIIIRPVVDPPVYRNYITPIKISPDDIGILQEYFGVDGTEEVVGQVFRCDERWEAYQASGELIGRAQEAARHRHLYLYDD